MKTQAQRDAEIIGLQSNLLDHTGHVRRGMTRACALEMVRAINLLRQRNGWPLLDMKGRWRR